jgi:hypothetical protein
MADTYYSFQLVYDFSYVEGSLSRAYSSSKFSKIPDKNLVLEVISKIFSYLQFVDEENKNEVKKLLDIDKHFSELENEEQKYRLNGDKIGLARTLFKQAIIIIKFGHNLVEFENLNTAISKTQEANQLLIDCHFVPDEQFENVLNELIDSFWYRKSWPSECSTEIFNIIQFHDELSTNNPDLHRNSICKLLLAESLAHKTPEDAYCMVINGLRRFGEELSDDYSEKRKNEILQKCLNHCFKLFFDQYFHGEFIDAYERFDWLISDINPDFYLEHVKMMIRYGKTLALCDMDKYDEAKKEQIIIYKYLNEDDNSVTFSGYLMAIGLTGYGDVEVIKNLFQISDEVKAAKVFIIPTYTYGRSVEKYKKIIKEGLSEKPDISINTYELFQKAAQIALFLGDVPMLCESTLYEASTLYDLEIWEGSANLYQSIYPFMSEAGNKERFVEYLDKLIDAYGKCNNQEMVMKYKYELQEFYNRN